MDEGCTNLIKYGKESFIPPFICSCKTKSPGAEINRYEYTYTCKDG